MRELKLGVPTAAASTATTVGALMTASSSESSAVKPVDLIALIKPGGTCSGRPQASIAPPALHRSDRIARRSKWPETSAAKRAQNSSGAYWMSRNPPRLSAAPAQADLGSVAEARQAKRANAPPLLASALNGASLDGKLSRAGRNRRGRLPSIGRQLRTLRMPSSHKRFACGLQWIWARRHAHARREMSAQSAVQGAARNPSGAVHRHAR